MNIQDVKELRNFIYDTIKTNEILFAENLCGKISFIIDTTNWMVDILEQIDKLEDGNTISLNDDIIPTYTQDLNNFINIINDSIYYRSFPNIFIEVIDKYCLLTCNFLRNSYPNENLINNLNNIQRLISLKLSLIELIGFTKQLIDKNRQLVNFTFEPFNLSKHYLQQLDNESQINDCKCQCQKQSSIEKCDTSDHLPIMNLVTNHPRL